MYNMTRGNRMEWPSSREDGGPQARAIADKLTSCQDGKNAFGTNADGHERTRGVQGTNCAVESKFAAADYVMRSYRGISVLNASGIVQQRTAHDFADRPLIESS